MAITNKIHEMNAKAMLGLTVAVPEPLNGIDVTVMAPPGSTLALGFDPRNAVAIRPDGTNDLAFVLDGGKATIIDFFAFANESLPDLKLPDGSVIASSEFFEGSGTDMTTVVLPDSDPLSGGIGEYGEDPGSLITGIDHLGSLETIYWDRSTEAAEPGASHLPPDTSWALPSETLLVDDAFRKPEPDTPAIPDTPVKPAMPAFIFSFTSEEEPPTFLFPRGDFHVTDGGDFVKANVGGAGDDVIYGADGGARIYGGSGNDVLYGGNGNDFICGDSGDDVIYGGAGRDHIEGNSGNDVLYGGDGPDYIYSGSGNDVIYGGRGDDVMYGGNGTKIFAWMEGDYDGGPDVIKYYTLGTDSLSFAGIFEDKTEGAIPLKDILTAMEAGKIDISADAQNGSLLNVTINEGEHSQNVEIHLSNASLTSLQIGEINAGGQEAQAALLWQMLNSITG